MQYNIKNKLNKLFTATVVSVLCFVSCDESIDVTSIDENNYTTNKETLAYVINGEGKRVSAMLEFRNNGTSDIYLFLSKNVDTDVKATFTYNASVLEAYNNSNETNYKLFPQNLVVLEGEVSIGKGTKKSSKFEVKLNTGDELSADKTYVLPLSTKIISGNAKASEVESNYLIFVKDLTKIPNPDKATGIKIISCMEVNDTNPLNNLCFRLKGNKKPLIDMVILFSANINYSTETGKVYVHNNENVQHLLDNREKYIKPLQDRGMKVILGILGNHDHSGIANLADETARAFAQELKAVCEAYQLDGVFFDDEYSNYRYDNIPVGFVYPSSEAASRLCYETKQAMPDKLVCAYVYSRTRTLPDIEGQTSGTFVDYGIQDYFRFSDLSDNYPGMPKSNMAQSSQEFNRGYWVSASRLTSIREEGYGAHMIFAMDPVRNNFDGQKSAMELIADKLFDDQLEIVGKDGVVMQEIDKSKFYQKDW